MKVKQKGFSAVEALIAIIIVGLIGGIGWYVYDTQANGADTTEVSSTPQETQQTMNEETGEQTTSPINEFEGMTYTVPTGWTEASGPVPGIEVSDGGNYLLSPDYKEAGLGHLSIESGAYISFHKLDWADITPETSIDEAAVILKNGEGYYDATSVIKTTISEQQVITFDSGHTTDGVSVFYKTPNNEWLEINFSTSTGNDGEYNAQVSPNYETFLSWIEEFISLNS